MSLLSAVLQEADKASTEEVTKHRDDLVSKVKELTEKVQMLSWSLQENLIDLYVNFIPARSLEQLNYRNRKENVLTEYGRATDDLKLIKDKWQVDDNEIKKITKKLVNDVEVLKGLCVAVEAKRELEKANHEFLRYNYTEAMVSLSELQNRLKSLTFDPKLSKAIFNVISQAENQYSIYSANLSVEWEDIFSWSERKGLYHLTYSLSVQQSDPTLIQNVLKALYATDRLNLELGKFSHFFIEKLLSSVIKHNCDIFTEDTIAPNHTIVFNIKIDIQDASKPSSQTVFNNLMAVFDFIQTTLGTRFDGEKTFIKVFADSIRGKFFNKIIEDCIRNNLPSCDSSYQTYKNLVIELDSFNKFLIEMKFVDSEESPLNKFVKDTECVLYNKKCDKLLSEVRDLLHESLSYGTITVGSRAINENDSILDITDNEAIWDLTKPLFLPKCVISQNVKRILTTIVEHLEESAKLPEEYSKKLISYIRSVAVMYQCIVPKKFKVNLECCPLDIALFFNNCFYLAHGLLGPPWKSILPSRTAEHLTTVIVESIQDLRVLGLEKISLYLQNQKNVIMKNVQPEVLSPWTHQTFEQFDGSINDALTIMKDLKQNWHGVLPSRMYELSICMLIQALCQAILQRILACGKPVAEDLVYMIAVRLEDVVQEIVELFETPMDFEKTIDIWTKFVRMPQLLKAQLLELTRLWNRGQDLSKCFTCEEVRQIIKMRFPDDKFRLKILVEIQ